MPTFTCSVDVANRKVSVNGAINTDQFISDVSVSISNVLNPFPAISTSPFLVTIGADYSSNDPNAAVSLTPAVFNQSLINFSPATVNTTGNMVFTLTTTNRLPIGSSITVKFPFNLQWN